MIDHLPAIYNKTSKKYGKTEVTPEIGFDLGFLKVQKNYITCLLKKFPE